MNVWLGEDPTGNPIILDPKENVNTLENDTVMGISTRKLSCR
jgi:hypothetical protein